MKQKTIGYIDIEDKELKMKITAEILINGIFFYHSQIKEVSKKYARILCKQGQKTRVYKIVLQEVK